jgi:hypothetical protein
MVLHSIYFVTAVHCLASCMHEDRGLLCDQGLCCRNEGEAAAFTILHRTRCLATHAEASQFAFVCVKNERCFLMSSMAQRCRGPCPKQCEASSPPFVPSWPTLHDYSTTNNMTCTITTTTNRQDVSLACRVAATVTCSLVTLNFAIP